MGYIQQKDKKIVQKNWGWERWLVNEDYCLKELFVFDGRRCSFHYHPVKRETFHIVKGNVYIWLEHNDNFQEDGWNYYMVGETITIEPNTRHCFEAVGGDALIYEVSSHHSDSDVIRVIPSPTYE